ncbi:MAG TPA: hypothetical protein P5244_14665, partial [Syntrophales bacterium]|nr:hypothetical protein [Syntrophales bacterium]
HPLPHHLQAKRERLKEKKMRGKLESRSKDVVNLWRDISSSPLENSQAGEWKEYAAYQKVVQYRAIDNLKEQLKGRFSQLHDWSKEDDIPY